MLSRISKKSSYFQYMTIQNSALICCSLLIFCFLFLLYTVSNYNGFAYFGQKYCLADAYVWFSKPRAYGILIMPIIVIIFINFTKYDQNPSILLRHETIKTWIKRKVIVAILLSLAIMIVAILVVTVITSLQVNTIINWDKKQSIYYSVLKNTNGKIQIGQIMLLACITIFLRNFFLCLSTLLLTMKFNNNILTLLIIAIITIFESNQKRIPIFYHYITLDYSLFEKPKIVFLYLIYCLIAILFFGIVIIRCSKKKEWMNEE